MGKNKKIILAITAFLLLSLVSYSAFWRINEAKKWAKVKEINSLFVESWGTIDYRSFDKYPDNQKRFLTSEYYQEQFGNKDFIYMRGANLAKDAYVSQTTYKKISEKSRKENTYVITSLIKETITTSFEKKDNEKLVTVYWEFVDDEPRATKVLYQ